MTDTLKIALAQLNPTVGDLTGNAERARTARAQAAEAGADLICFPELFICGYPPEDLVLKPAFIDAARRTVEELAGETADGGPAMLIGTPWPGEDKPHNSVALLEGGEVRDVRHKVELPNYGVFDEKRIFSPGEMPGPMSFRGVRLGVPICEDIWIEDVCECLAETGAELLIVPNGSPFTLTKQETRQNVAVARVAESGLPLVYLNQIGGQDELVFEGASFVLNAGGALATQMLDWREQVAMTEWQRGPEGWTCAPGEKAVLIEGDAAAYQACVRGLRDYVEKNGFPGVVLGLSGGIDSALSAAIAVDALGADRVHCIMLPYKYTSDMSRTDAAACADALGVRYDTVPIAAPVEGFIAALDPVLDGGGHGVTVENLQSRTRGTILMAVSNETGAMLVTTGNKSEMSVGYATLYGDMNGGFNPIKDLYKTQVYSAARWRDANQPIDGLGPAGEVIPENIITKAPSAELAEDQTDQDTLPPYDALDDILRCKIEHEMPHDEIVARGHGDNIVRQVENMLRIAEYKRRQSAPGVKITERVFGRDWRYPIANKFRESRS